MGLELELGRGIFLAPVLVRAVRTMGVRSHLDLDRLADAGLNVEAVAGCWQRGAAPEPLLVGVAVNDGRMEVAFTFADPHEAVRTRSECLPADGAGPLERLASAVEHAGDAEGSRLVLTFG